VDLSNAQRDQMRRAALARILAASGAGGRGFRDGLLGRLAAQVWRARPNSPSV
jgi:hypothetical protein